MADLNSSMDDYDRSTDESEQYSDEEFDDSIKAVLPVADFDQYDPAIPPQSGSEYLRRVQLEAKREPKIKIATNLDKIFKHTISLSNELEYELDDEPPEDFIIVEPEYRLSPETISIVIQSFISVRNKLEQLKQTFGNGYTSEQNNTNHSKGWWKEYCLNSCNKLKLKSSLQESYNPELVYETNVPQLTELAQLDQPLVGQLLSFHYEWIIEEQFTIGNGLWIYSLLAALDNTQTGEMYNTIRQISRRCSNIRYKLINEFDDQKTIHHSETLQKISSLNLIITLIGQFFGQKDLILKFLNLYS
ncbi:gem (nuclear organelle) associated protein 2 [Blomia tropicalis]|nr:gem (nuclear organelle) associated protein 2 [Blomia tropicalis]